MILSIIPSIQLLDFFAWVLESSCTPCVYTQVLRTKSPRSLLSAASLKRRLFNRGLITLLEILILSLAFSYTCIALPDDREKIAQLAAHFVDLDQQTHYGKYKGHVEFHQGSSHLDAVEVTTQGNQQNQLICATAAGNKTRQAHFWTQVSLDKPILHAYADLLRYYPTRHFIELIGNAHISQGKDSFSAPKISYDTLNQHVISKNGKLPVLILVHPRKS